MEKERTLILIKPDGVKRNLIGEVIKRFEACGLKVVAMHMTQPTKEQMDNHYPKEDAWITGLGNNTIRSYKEFEMPTTLIEDFGTENPLELGKMVREWLLDYMVSGPIVKIVIQGPHAVKVVRKIVGPTIPSFAEGGTIRGDLALDSPDLANSKKRAIQNLIHASGNIKEAEHEIQLWFSPEELHDYQTGHDAVYSGA